MAHDGTTTRELYIGGLESLLSLEIQHEDLLPTMVSLTSSERLRRFLEDLPPMIVRQRRRLELLLRGTPGHADLPLPARNGLEEDLLDLRLVKDRDDRDMEVVKASAWIAGLQVEQYSTTRDCAIRLGSFEAARHLQRSLNAVGASRLRLLRIAQRIRFLASWPSTLDVGDFDRIPLHAVALP